MLNSRYSYELNSEWTTLCGSTHWGRHATRGVKTNKMKSTQHRRLVAVAAVYVPSHAARRKSGRESDMFILTPLLYLMQQHSHELFITKIEMFSLTLSRNTREEVN